MWSDLAKEMETGIVNLYAGPKYVGVGLEGGREEGDLGQWVQGFWFFVLSVFGVGVCMYRGIGTWFRRFSG